MSNTESQVKDPGTPPVEEYSAILILETDARRSMVMFHPPGTYQWEENGETKRATYRDLSNDAMKAAKPGALMAIPSERDENGGELWKLSSYDWAHDPEQRQAVADFMDKQLAGTGIRAIVLPPGTRLAGKVGLDVDLLN